MKSRLKHSPQNRLKEKIFRSKVSMIIGVYCGPDVPAVSVIGKS
jgi:hypothetical protein